MRVGEEKLERVAPIQDQLLHLEEQRRRVVVAAGTELQVELVVDERSVVAVELLPDYVDNKRLVVELEGRGRS